MPTPASGETREAGRVADVVVGDQELVAGEADPVAAHAAELVPEDRRARADERHAVLEQVAQIVPRHLGVVAGGSAATDGEAGLDDLLPALVRQDVDLAVLTALASDLMGAPPDVLHIDKLPGCNSIP